MFRTWFAVGRTTVFAAFGSPQGLAKIVRRHALLFVILIGGAFLWISNAHAQVELWLTDPGGSARFENRSPAWSSAVPGTRTRRSKSIGKRLIRPSMDLGMP